MNIRESFERVGFTPEEKMDLTARLEWAAEQEDLMTNATKKTIKRISGGMIFGIAAAAVMTVGAVAAAITPGLRTWFDTTTPGAPEALVESVYRLNRSETYEGWTVTLDECIGDDSSLYIGVDITAPEGTVFTSQEDAELHVLYWLGEVKGLGMDLQEIPDEDSTDNRKSFILQKSWQSESLRGQVMTITIGPIEESWWTGALTDKAEFHEQTIVDHQWVFEDVTLDFPDQTVQLEPNTVVPWAGGTATVTRLEVSPLSILVELEGGSCATYNKIINGNPFEAGEEEQVVTNGGLVFSSGEPSQTWVGSVREMEESLALQAVLQDGTVVDAIANVGQYNGFREGLEGPETPYFSTCRRYAQYSTGPAGLVAPAQVDHVTVCGVDIPVNPSQESAPTVQPAAPELADIPEEAAPAVGTVTAETGLNVRSGPGTEFQIVDGLAKDAQVTILEEENGFYQIRYSGDKTGYVSKDYVTVG